MKKIIIIILFFMVAGPSHVYAKETGHAAFEEIIFPKDATTKLIIDMSYQEKQIAHERLKEKKFIGWTIYTINRNAEAIYIAETIFSRSNTTSTAYEFNYLLREGDTIETSVSADGSISSKNKGKIKTVEAALDLIIRGQIGKKTTLTRSEETRIKVNVEPNTKLSMKIKGEAKVSNGVGKYYFFGIRFKSGEWEYIDVVTRFYELSEERIQP
ncbi:MAG TPA: hypothetical protein PLR26_00870 [Bacilli bacterium]|nr:hypothetical protein [Bacilli bacterium]